MVRVTLCWIDGLPKGQKGLALFGWERFLLLFSFVGVWWDWARGMLKGKGGLLTLSRTLPRADSSASICVLESISSIRLRLSGEEGSRVEVVVVGPEATVGVWMSSWSMR